jgi:hypothetical protein
MTRELDDRQEMLHRIDTHKTRPTPLEPSRRPRKTRWQRARAWLANLFHHEGAK